MPAHIKIWSRSNPPKRYEMLKADSGFLVEVPNKGPLPVFAEDLLQENVRSISADFGRVTSRIGTKHSTLVVTEVVVKQ